MIRRASLLTLLPVYILACVGIATSAYAQSLDNNQGAIEITEPDSSSASPPSNGGPKGFKPKVGRKAAAKYMGAHQATPSANDSAEDSGSTGSPGSSDTHYLALHFGTFVSDNSYKWGGRTPDENVGKLNVGLTYRMGEWINSADMTLRFEYSAYQLQEGKAGKLSFLPVILFPDAKSRFPLYFGAGLGPGVFVSQLPGESTLTLDYQLLAGVRFFNVFEKTGFFIEAGIKNHLFLLSDGQFNGTFVALGTVFSF